MVTKQNLNGQLFQIVDELVRRGVTLDQAKREFEKQYIVAMLRTNEGNLTRTAKTMGVHRNTLRNKVCDLGSCDCPTGTAFLLRGPLGDRSDTTARSPKPPRPSEGSSSTC